MTRFARHPKQKGTFFSQTGALMGEALLPTLKPWGQGEINTTSSTRDFYFADTRLEVMFCHTHLDFDGVSLSPKQFWPVGQPGRDLAENAHAASMPSCSTRGADWNFFSHLLCVSFFFVHSFMMAMCCTDWYLQLADIAAEFVDNQDGWGGQGGQDDSGRPGQSRQPGQVGSACLARIAGAIGVARRRR